MREPFIGRTEELKLLETAFEAKSSALIPIYGRRRVGKSELILRFLAGKRAIYFVGKRAPPVLQIREFLQSAAAILEEPLLASVPSHDWATAFRMVYSRWPKGKTLVIAMDEFQWTAEASRELPSVLQELWDREWAKSRNVLLILCGSYIGFMERHVLGKTSPLFGRRTAQILLKPFGFQEAAAFHPAWSHAEQARAYFICGGIPLYLRLFAPRDSVEMNVAAMLLNEFAPLYREPDFLLREELRDVENYYAILLSIAAGQHAHSGIAQQTGINERSLHYYLQQLINLGYLSRRYPLTTRKATARQVHFALDDPLLRFWFRFVYPHVSLIAQMGAERAMRELVRRDLEAYFGSCFERLCREALPLIYSRDGMTAPFHVGEYWDKKVQIDVVGLRGDKWIDLAECKWGDRPSPSALAAELEEKVLQYPNPSNATIQRHIFTRQALRKPDALPDTVRWHTLQDLYRLGR